MTMSTKVPPSRTNGSGMPGGGPVPAPRVVGNRRIRTGGIALATMLLAFGAALSGIALVSVSRTSSYLAVAQPVSAGSVIVASDLTSVQISGGNGLTLIPAIDLRQVVGRHAAVPLLPGTLLSPTQLSDTVVIPDGQAEVKILVKGSNLVTAHPLARGEHITLDPIIATQAPKPGTATPQTNTIVATVIDISAPGTDGSVNMDISVSSEFAYEITQINAGGGFAVTLVSGN